VLDASEVDRHARLVADRPRVAARGDREDIAGSGLAFCAVVHDDLHSARENVAEMDRLAAVGSGDRFDVLGPGPPGLEHALEHRPGVKRNHSGLAHVGHERTRFLRRFQALDLKS
jgi:hypothetical protein